MGGNSTCASALYYYKKNDHYKFLGILGPPIAIMRPYVLLLFISFFSLFLQRQISVVSRPITAELSHIIGNGCNFKTRSKICGSSPKKFGAEKRAFLRDFGRLRSSITNISGTEQDIDNQKTALQTTISPASADIIW